MTQSTPLPYDGNALLGAVQWCEALARGPMMTSIAILAIAAIGLGMLGGRVSTKRGISAVFGCFIVFGAPALAGGLFETAMKGATYPDQFADVVTPYPQFVPPPREVNNDPHAGAAVPNPRIHLDDLY